MAGFPREIKDIAKTLIETAHADKASAEVLRDLRTVEDVFHAHPEFVRELSETTIPLEKRQNALKHALKDVHPYVLNALLMLLRRDTLTHVEQFTQQSILSGQKIAKIYEAKITTAVPLTPDEREDLRKTLDESFGGTHELSDTVDPKILGGLIVDIGDRRYDASVKGKITRLRQAIAS